METLCSNLDQLKVLLLAVFMALVLKIWLVLGGFVPFNSDEAVVALMARHILQGERPVFFYGQAYMGSLDAWLVAGAFRVFGEQVGSIRIIQCLLYVFYLVTMWVLGRRFFRDKAIANLAVLLAAIPCVLVTTYTTASLGGYGEVLVLGNLILWLGYEVTWGRWRNSWFSWLALGVLGGVAFWILSMAVIYFLPVGVLALTAFKRDRFVFWVLAAVGFLTGSSPWWIYNFSHAGAALAAITGANFPDTTPLANVFGLFFLGLPALVGTRYPWSADFAPWWVVFLQLVVCLGAFIYFVHQARSRKLLVEPGTFLFLGLFVVGFGLVFVFTHFGLDATGRYLLPLYLPVVLVLAIFLAGAWSWRKVAGIALLVLIMILNGFETVRAALSVDGITTQFSPITRFDNQSDDDLLAFLHQNGELRGYTNYWVSFRIAFLSQEKIIFSARLPYKADLSYTPRDDRYPAYSQLVAVSSKVAYITSQHPVLDQKLRGSLHSLGVDFKEARIGPYVVLYNLSRTVQPEEFGFILVKP